MENVSIRKMTHDDYQVMSEWLSTKEVLEFYGDIHSPFTLEEVKRKYEPRVIGDHHVHPYIIDLENKPIGYMQHYYHDDKSKEEFGYSPSQHVIGIDQFIGVPSLFNKGYGTQIVRKFVDYICLNMQVDVIVLDPEITNTRAIRCYEKCGFREVKSINSNQNVLMEIKVHSLEGEKI